MHLMKTLDDDLMLSSMLMIYLKDQFQEFLAQLSSCSRNSLYFAAIALIVIEKGANKLQDSLKY